MSNRKPSLSLKVKIVRHLREWHRKLGIFAAFFLIFLSVTGISLNHTNSLSLAHYGVSNSYLLDLYGIKPPKNTRFFQQHAIAVTDKMVWLNGSLLFESEASIISAGKFQQFWLVVSQNQLSIFTEQGELVDRISSALGLPENITAMSIENSQVIFNTDQGYFQTDKNFFDFTEIQTLIEPKWLIEEVVEPQIIQAAQLRFQSQFLSAERIILDAHSGRLFGDFGVYFMDFVAVLLILLSLSGIYIWIRYARSKR